jgi:hypothetical protein
MPPNTSELESVIEKIVIGGGNMEKENTKIVQKGGATDTEIIKLNLSFYGYIIEKLVNNIIDTYNTFNIILQENQFIGNNIGYFKYTRNDGNNIIYKYHTTEDIDIQIQLKNETSTDNVLRLLFFKNNPVDLDLGENKNVHFVLIFTTNVLNLKNVKEGHKLFIGMIKLDNPIDIDYATKYEYPSSDIPQSSILSLLTPENRAMPCFFNNEKLVPVPVFSNLNRFTRDKLNHLEYLKASDSSAVLSSIYDVPLIKSYITNILNQSDTTYLDNLKKIIMSNSNSGDFKMDDNYNKFFDTTTPGDKIKFLNFDDRILISSSHEEIKERYEKYKKIISNLPRPSAIGNFKYDTYLDKLNTILYKGNYFISEKSDILNLKDIRSDLSNNISDYFNLIKTFFYRHSELIFNSLLYKDENGVMNSSVEDITDLICDEDTGNILFPLFIKHVDNMEIKPDFSFDNLSDTFKEKIKAKLKGILIKDADYTPVNITVFLDFLKTKKIDDTEKMKLLNEMRVILSLEEIKPTPQELLLQQQLPPPPPQQQLPPPPQQHRQKRPPPPPFGQQPFRPQSQFGQQPFGQQPFGQQPFGQQPFGQQPFGQQPFGQQPFGQLPPPQQQGPPQQQQQQQKPPKGGGYKNIQKGGGITLETVYAKLFKSTVGKNIIIEIKKIWKDNNGIGDYFLPTTEEIKAVNNLNHIGMNLQNDTGLTKLVGNNQLIFNQSNNQLDVVSADGQRTEFLKYIERIGKIEELKQLRGHTYMPGGILSMLGELSKDTQLTETSDRMKEMLKRDKPMNDKIQGVVGDLDKLLEKITAGNPKSFETALFNVDTYLYKLQKLEKMFKVPKEDEIIPKAKKETADTVFNPDEIGKTPDTLLLDSRVTSEKISNTGMYKEIMNTKYTLLKNYSDSMNLKTTAFPSFVNNVYKPPSSIGTTGETAHGPRDIIREFLVDISSKPHEDIKIGKYINTIPPILKNIDLIENIILELSPEQAAQAIFRLYILSKDASSLFNPQKNEWIDMKENRYNFPILHTKYPNFPLFKEDFLWEKDMGGQGVGSIIKYEITANGIRESREWATRKQQAATYN